MQDAETIEPECDKVLVDADKAASRLVGSKEKRSRFEELLVELHSEHLQEVARGVLHVSSTSLPLVIRPAASPTSNVVDSPQESVRGAILAEADSTTSCQADGATTPVNLSDSRSSQLQAAPLPNTVEEPQVSDTAFQVQVGGVAIQNRTWSPTVPSSDESRSTRRDREGMAGASPLSTGRGPRLGKGPPNSFQGIGGHSVEDYPSMLTMQNTASLSSQPASLSSNRGPWRRSTKTGTVSSVGSNSSCTFPAGITHAPVPVAPISPVLDNLLQHPPPTRSQERTISATSVRDFALHRSWKMEYCRPHKRKPSARRSSRAMMAVEKRETEKNVPTAANRSLLDRFVVHPSSMKRLCWDLMSMSLLGYDIVTIPFMGAFNPPTNTALVGMTWFTLLFWTCDMPLSMFTGYQQGKVAIVDPRLTIKHYLKSWFILDCIIIGLDWTTLMLNGTFSGDSENGGSVTRLGRTLRTLRFVRTLRLIRVLKLKRIVQAIQDSINTEAISIIFGITKIISSLIIANHIVACGWYSIAQATADNGTSWITVREVDKRSITYQYTTSLHWSLTQFTPASMEVVPETTGERIYAVVVILFAMIAFSSFVSILTASMNQLQNLSSNESRQFWLLRRYLRDWNVRRKVGLRVQRYCEYAYQKQKCKVQESEVGLLSLLSEPLRLELKHETFSGYLQGHPLFRLCSDQSRVFGRALNATNLAHQDIIFACGEQASRLVFLTAGLLEYTQGIKVDENGNPLYEDGPGLVTLPSGDTLGSNSNDDRGPGPPQSEIVDEGLWVAEAVLWTDWTHTGDLQCMTECQVIFIDAGVFGDAVTNNVVLWQIMRRYAENFVNILNLIDFEDLTDLNHQMFNPADAISEADLQNSVLHGGDEYETEGGMVSWVRWIVMRITKVLGVGHHPDPHLTPVLARANSYSNKSLPYGRSGSFNKQGQFSRSNSHGMKGGASTASANSHR